MKFILTRKDFRSDGIFGSLTDEDGNLIAYTLERSYLRENGAYLPKVPAGEYNCLLGRRRLAGMKEPFMTYEVKKVPGHFGILFHAGNYNRDSEGCILLGKGISQMANGEMMITNSRKAFAEFMAKTSGKLEIQLSVRNSI